MDYPFDVLTVVQDPKFLRLPQGFFIELLNPTVMTIIAIAACKKKSLGYVVVERQFRACKMDFSPVPEKICFSET